MSYQTFLDNRTPFIADKFVLPDKDGQEFVLVVVSATFCQEGSCSRLQLAARQSSLELADLYFGPPHIASVRRESDIALVKPFVDVLINGRAYAPHERPTTSVNASVAVGDIRKELLVSGDRAWRKGSFGTAATSPKPFVSMPITYERAFGGIDMRPNDPKKHAAEVRNLSGVGFRGTCSYDPTILTELPNIEYPNDRQSTQSDLPQPAGFGVVSRGWQPRLAFAGTFDPVWLTQRWPLLPSDFDPRHYQAAPRDQQSSKILGGETVILKNLTPEGLWQFRLPTLKVPMWLLFDNKTENVRMRLDTLMIEPDAKQVTLICRGGIRTRRNRPALREIVLGNMSAGWLRARCVGKRYVDLAGQNGVLRYAPAYVL